MISDSPDGKIFRVSLGAYTMLAHSVIEKIRIPLSRALVVFSCILLMVSRSGWEDISILSNLFFLIGCILVGIGSLGRLWCSLYIAGYKNSRLITTGPYSISRNPLYFFSFIGAIGIGFTTETLLFVILAILFFGLCYPAVIHSEEQRLLDLHVEKYEAYCKETPAFFPRWSLLKEPDTYTVNPKIFKKNAFGALWFVWMVGIIEIIEGLHEAGILSAVIKLY